MRFATLLSLVSAFAAGQLFPEPLSAVQDRFWFGNPGQLARPERDVCTTDPMMWAISKKGEEQKVLGYGVGTIHVSVDSLNIDPSIWTAAKCARTVFVELRIDVPSTLAKIRECLVEIQGQLPPQLTIGALSNSTKADLQQSLQVLETKSPALYKQYFPSGWSASDNVSATYDRALAIADATFAPPTTSGVFDTMLVNSNPSKGEIETAADQCKVLKQIKLVPFAVQQFMFPQSIEALKEAVQAQKSPQAPLLALYRCGDLTKLSDKVHDEAFNTTGKPAAVQDYYRALNTTLWTNRDGGMAKFILEDLAGNKGPAMYAVGTGHFPGIIRILERNNYTVTQYKRNATFPKCTTPPTNAGEASSAQLPTPSAIVFGVLLFLGFL